MSLDTLVTSMPTGPGFTAALDVPRIARRVSAVIATYNRCPFDPASARLRDNPLTWALDSLLAQAGHALAEIVIADDGSSDYTPAVLNTYLTRRGEVPVRCIRLDEHRGAWAARNAAASAARSRWLLFGDDDCVFAPHYAIGAAYIMDQLSDRDPAAAAVMLPFYYRAARPRQTTPRQQIGRLAPDLAQFATRFHAWPLEYLPDPPRLGHLHGGYAQPRGFEADDGDRRARDLGGRRHCQRAGPGPHVAVAGGEEQLVQLPRPRLPGGDPALAVRDQRGVRGAVLTCLLQRREELIAGQRREAGGRVGQQRAQFLARAVLLHLGLPRVPGRRWLRGARPDPGKIQRGRQPGGLLRHAQALTCSRLCRAAMSAAARPEAHPSSSVARLPRS